MKIIKLFENFSKALSILLCVFAINTYGQDPSFAVPKLEDLVKVPPSPEAQAFAKYGNTPVSMYTGSPDISVPIATLKGRDIAIPISLTYDASGIKVEQIATWVGLGWNLNAGGMVTRQTNGLPDDYIYSASEPKYYPFYSPTISSDYEFVRGFTATENSIYAPGDLKRYFDFMQKVLGTSSEFGSNFKLEIQPDTYSFHVLGLSGTLVIDYTTSTAWCIEHPEIKAVPTFVDEGLIPIKKITGWTITDALGNSFYFILPEKTYTYDNNLSDNFREYNSSWLLTKIETTNKRDVVEFNYDNSVMWEQPQLVGRGDIRIYGPPQYVTSYTQEPPMPEYKISQSDLRTIFINGKKAAEFNPDTQNPLLRKDLAGRKALTEIQTFGSDGAITNRIRLRQSYFGPAATTTDEKLLRLRLDAVENHGNTIVSNPLVYKFLYQGSDLPSRESFSQDYWGYYNGAPNSTLIPYNYDYDQDPVGFVGANRQPNLTFCNLGVLTSITYPTGGSTEYVYQMHQLGEAAFTQKEEYSVTGLGLNGTPASATTPNHYWDCEPDILTPKSVEASFTISEAGDYKFTILATGDPNIAPPGPQMQFLTVYFQAPLNGTPVNRSFCDLYDVANDPAQITRYISFAPGFSNTSTHTLQPGYYRIMIANNRADLAINIDITGIHTVTGFQANQAGGLRTAMTLDKDSDGSLVTKKLYYYGDLSTVAATNINEAYLLSDIISTSGLLQDQVNFEEAKVSEYYHMNEASGSPEFISTTVVNRYSTNRTQSSSHVTYSVVSEVQFSNNSSAYNGFTVVEFANQLDNYSIGFSKSAVLNGKILKKRTYDYQGNLKAQEENTYEQRSVNGGGRVGYAFASSMNFRKDLYIKSALSSPSDEFFVHEDPIFTNLHDPDSPPGSLTESHCSAGNPIDHVVYNILKCYTFGSKFEKKQYVYSRFWPVLTSTTLTNYDNDTYVTVSQYSYDNTNHFQVTQTQHSDSKGDLEITKFSYPDEMQAAYPSDPIWPSMISQNRIAEKVKTQASQNTTLLATENTTYKTVGTMILPDKMQYSMGSYPVEDRVQYSQYDSYGNLTEALRINDVKMAVVYGYNNTLPIAEVKNATAGQVFHNSFEESDGNSTDGDSKSGKKSLILSNNYSQTISTLTPGQYVLSYWYKSAGKWLQQSSVVSVAGTSYTISIASPAQIDEVRFYPVGAFMSTYCHQPGVGIIAQTDPNGVTASYEYDTFNRLVLIRDNNSKILKNFKYGYFTGSTQ